jgi:uncharacterized protein (DUF2147 family)
MRIVKSTLVALGLVAGLSTAALANEPYGTWVRPSTGTTVDFYKCGANLCAKVVGVKGADKSAVGKVIMGGAVKSGDNTWKGDLLNTEDGKTYSGVVKLLGPKSLNLAGCVLGGLICKDETWNKVN